MRRAGSALSVVLTAAFLFAAACKLWAVEPAFCPVMPGSRVQERYHVDYAGRRIYLCCASCIRKFRRNPDKYLTWLAEHE